MVRAGTDGWIISANGNSITRATAEMSLPRSKRRFGTNVSLIAIALDRIAMVWPSGSERATASVTIISDPPGLFSTTTGRPSRSCNFWPISRATMSALPPAE